MTPIPLFFYLQFLDGLTTYIGLGGFGVWEVVFVVFLFLLWLGLFVGIVLFKLLCCLVGYKLFQRHPVLLPLVNWCCAAVVVWNLMVILFVVK